MLVGHADCDRRFLQFVLDTMGSEEMPDLTEWPYSADDYRSIKERALSVQAAVWEAYRPGITVKEFVPAVTEKLDSLVPDGVPGGYTFQKTDPSPDRRHYGRVVYPDAD